MISPDRMPTFSERAVEPDRRIWVGSSLSAALDGNGQAAIKGRYLRGRKSSAIAACSGASGKKVRRWQYRGKSLASSPLAGSQSR